MALSASAPVSLILATLLWLAAPTAGAAESPVGQVIANHGTVGVLRHEELLPLDLDSLLFQADVVITGVDGRVKLRFFDGTIIALGSEGRLVLTRMTGEANGGSRTLVELILGLIRAAVNPGGGGLDVETRSAVASSRATVWLVEVAGESSAVFVAEGRVEVRSSDPGIAGTVELGPGEGTSVAAGEPPKPVSRWGAARVRALIDRIEGR